MGFVYAFRRLASSRSVQEGAGVDCPCQEQWAGTDNTRPELREVGILTNQTKSLVKSLNISGIAGRGYVIFKISDKKDGPIKKLAWN